MRTHVSDFARATLIAACLGACLAAASSAAPAPDAALAGGPGAFKGMGAPAHPKVPVAWNRYYDHAGITDICRRLAAAHPGLCRLESIGKSYAGRDLWALTITDFSAGDPARRSGYYIDGNIHANELQGSEVALYTAWYLLENFGVVEGITRLVRERTFYIVPTINPDGRDDFLHRANSPNSPRSGVVPRDDDGDGQPDEDQAADLDGDGNITQMRKADPNGRWKTSPDDPRLMVTCEPDEKGQWTLLGEEGTDQDRDGSVAEDPTGYYDPNRDWGWNWAPRYVQQGAERYPFSLPESRAVRDFVRAHPNIAGAQTYHNAMGAILKGPGERSDAFQPEDVATFDLVGRRGEEVLPGYRYLTVWSGLYTVYGGELDWFYGARGVLCFSNELWTAWNLFRKDAGGGFFGAQPDLYRFDRLLLFGEGVVPWRAYRHPQFGDVEIGGLKKMWTRMPPTFLLEEECHRNMAFTLFHAWTLPLVHVDSLRVTALPGGVRQVDVRVVNERPMATHTAQDRVNRITPPDAFTLTVPGGKVLAGFAVDNEYLGNLAEQKEHPERLVVPGIAGNGVLKLRWLVSGDGAPTVTVESVRATVRE
ncbi:MAG: peptidase M14 [Candidatus Eisenbacteria bacterium]|nr:peptidase M14 [Candidatus Eisenbacteria bacterium]